MNPAPVVTINNFRLRTYSRTIEDEGLLKELLLHFIGCWFMVEPLPDGEYELTVKEDMQHRLDRLLGH